MSPPERQGPQRIGRRAVLSSAGALSMGALAGCMQPLLEGDSDDGDPTDGSTGGSNGESDGDSTDDDPAGPESVSLEETWRGSEIDAFDEPFHPRFIRSVDETLYITSQTSIVEFDPSTGTQQRVFDLELVEYGEHGEFRERVLDCTVFDDELYVTTEFDDDEVASRVHKYGSSTEREWTYELEDPDHWINAIEVTSGWVYIGASTSGSDAEGSFTVLNQQGNSEFYEYWPPDDDLNSFQDFVTHDRFLYIGTLGPPLVFDMEARTLLNTQEEFGISPGRNFTLVDDILYAAPSSNLRALDLDAREELYDVSVERHTRPPAVLDDRVIIGNSTGLYGHDRSTGEELWYARTTDGIEDSPAVIDGVAFGVDDHEMLYAVDVETGDLLYDDDAPVSRADQTVSIGSELVLAGERLKSYSVITE
ncbi:outer membrane protein assembly factor BamB family protein [Natranaeroarchaeum sulfidigenes]|nr:PQQ-binding-like beta-propeller repeat protein [Natranaeroarchaeum sulfidigenes]